MGSWRNWLAQESYTLKVAGSSPALPTKKLFYGYGRFTQEMDYHQSGRSRG